ncbi:MAG: hypothetical protein FWD73_00440 [Polyangiaceae bacterium]|nr:hypothetical protein [Polyangiaceae bacterium]
MSKFVVLGKIVLSALGLTLALGSSDEGVRAASPFIESEASHAAWASDMQHDGTVDNVAASNDNVVNALRYDQLVQKSAHNAYERFEPLFDQLAWHGVRSVELDIHETKHGEPSPRGNWFVYHEDYPLFRDTTCTMLSDCLGQLAAFHRAVPTHEPITLFVDLKERFGTTHTPEEFDQLLADVLGRAAIVTPEDLMNRCPTATSLRQAVTASTHPSALSKQTTMASPRETAPDACSFPTVGEMRGKFIVAVTGGTACDSTSAVNTYAKSTPTKRVALLAPNVDDTCTMHEYDEQPNIVFVNMPWPFRAYAREARARGLVARVYGRGVFGGIDAPDEFEAARETGAQHLATDMVNGEQDVWTHGGPIGGIDAGNNLHVVRASSGDIWKSADSFWFSYEAFANDATYSTFVSVPSSHVEPFAKACLMARASEDPEAPNVAVCRMFDKRAPRMQVRATKGGATTQMEMTNIQGVSPKSPAFLRLAIRKRAAGSDVFAQGSIDGERWQTIGQAFVDSPLPLRGTAVSSHGTSHAEAVFGNVVREASNSSSRIDTFPLSLAIGNGASGGAVYAMAKSP